MLSKTGYFIGSVSQLEPFHSYSCYNYTFYGFYSLLKDAKLSLLEVRPGIDSISLIKRSFKKFCLKDVELIEDKFFINESPYNYIIDLLYDKNDHYKKNLAKLQITGQFCFLANKEE